MHTKWLQQMVSDEKKDFFFRKVLENYLFLLESFSTSIENLETEIHKLIQSIVSRSLKKRRQGQDLKFIEIGDPCMKRLYKKSHKMIYSGKPINPSFDFFQG